MLDPRYNDVFAQIMSYLSPQEKIRFKMVSKAFANVSDTTQLDQLWQPYLNQLREFDNQVPSQAPEGVDPKSPWRGNAFKEHFIRIRDQQLKDIQNMINFTTFAENELPEKLLNKAKESLNNREVTIASLEQRRKLIEKINIHLIKTRLRNPNSTYLNINGLGINEIPAKIFQDPTLKNFWSNLATLECQTNYLRSLPEEIYQLPNLRKVFFEDNFLEIPPKFKEKFGEFYYENNKTAQFTNEPRYEGEEVPGLNPADEGANHKP